MKACDSDLSGSLRALHRGRPAGQLRERADMKGGTTAALALGAGYLLGRRRKMRTAALLAAAAATGGVGGLGGMALRRGFKMLASTEALGKVGPELGEIATTVRNDLLDAGKAAATAAITGRIESLSDSIHERAETLRNPGGRLLGGGGGRDEEADESEDGEEPGDRAGEEPQERRAAGREDGDEAPVRRRSPRGPSPVTRARASSEPAGSSGRRQGTRGRPRVSRTGR
jgi:hypothetical protein